MAQMHIKDSNVFPQNLTYFIHHNFTDVTINVVLSCKKKRDKECNNSKQLHIKEF